MKVATYTNNNGKLCTDDYDPDVDGFDPCEEDYRELLETEAMDAYLCGYDDDFDDRYEDEYDEPQEVWYSHYEEEAYYGVVHDDPFDYCGPLYPDE